MKNKTIKNEKLPTFKRSFLHPKYWGLWLGIGIWYFVMLLPYPLLKKVGNGLGALFAKTGIGKRRAKIARRNLALCFPDYSAEKIEQILQQNMRSVGMAVIETGMAWFWSNNRIKKWTKVKGLEHLQQTMQDGVILVGVHFLTLELGARMIGLIRPGIGIYRPNDNPVWDWLQTKGRLRSNKDMVDRKDLRGMLKALKNKELIWYAPDHDYGRKNAVFVPLFNVHDAASTTGSYYLLKSVPDAKVVPFSPIRDTDENGYTLDVSAVVNFDDISSETDIAIRMNKIVELEIMKGIEQYMWLHRRFKTRPDENMPSYYD